MQIATDTATICIYDTKCLEHRKDDDGDWWSLPWEELEEVNRGNALFLNVGSDGFYEVNVESKNFDTTHEYNLKIPSGRLFIGPGEDITAGGFEPGVDWEGTFFELKAGNYICRIRREENVIRLFFSPGGDGENKLTDLIRIDELDYE